MSDDRMTDDSIERFATGDLVAFDEDMLRDQIDYVTKHDREWVEELHAHRARIAAHAAAHPERLSEEEVAYAAFADTPHEMVFKHHKAMGHEIQQRRAADLTPDDLRALRLAAELLDNGDDIDGAVAAIRKAIRAHGATP